MSKGEEILEMIDKLLSMDLNDLKKDKKEEIIYTINEIIIDLQSVVATLDNERSVNI